MKNLPNHVTILTPPPGTDIVGTIQFVHGMAEHRQRYIEVMNFFTLNGYVCAISDLRGHGDNITRMDDLGYFGEDGLNLLVKDIHDITLYLKGSFPDLPFFLIGHSLGSLIARVYAKTYDSFLTGLILTGSPSDSPVKGAARILIKGLSLFKGARYKSPFMGNLVTGPFSRKFPEDGSCNSWITADPQVWRKYDSDEKCGFLFTLNGYEVLMNLLAAVYSPDGWKLNNPALPVVFLSGEDDPCMTDMAGFLKAVQTMKDAGYINVTYRIYKNRRHEILNDYEKEKVFEDILEYLTV
ncbi:alpha/beta fold hydrolase [Parasporobacterium paucivorans]|uniref:Lysophospholipase, alpha-beta hydrolase superfamily n=1 Tax=Parasporobacterium paucivorans DSM 15970 TaxID=1122934 RepID=A0A1M6AK14_9FIRM|nr:alpha/beta hydrolase [Parasporobacterium paucivorans]SHI36757.1 Lysophospholipase, alpha-beta hydrolase superfamily [Parasporobacterium paucivorans DSM 15970]